MTSVRYLLIVVIMTMQAPFSLAWPELSPPGGYSGYGRWYLSASAVSGLLDQNLSERDPFTYQAPRIAIGGVGPEAVRFELAWTPVESADKNFRLSGFDAELWFPWRPENRIRPYLIIGLGHYRYYGDDIEFFNEQDADNGARAFNFGFAATANLAQQTEIDISIHQQYLEWDSGVENGKGANATIRSLRLTLRQLF